MSKIIAMNLRKLNPSNFRNIIFGIEDSLVSTVGVLFGVATAMTDKKSLILTGVIVIAVEALSMGAGSFLTEESTNEMAKRKIASNPVLDGILMFFSYIIAGLIPLTPYVLFNVDIARFASVGMTLIALFFLGYLPTRNLKGGIRMFLIAGLAILIGFLIATGNRIV